MRLTGGSMAKNAVRVSRTIELTLILRRTHGNGIIGSRPVSERHIPTGYFLTVQE